jgi:hypothetical protein
LPDVRVLGHPRALTLTLTPRGWGQRAGMLFVGAIHGTESPNYDSLCWFVDAVLPLIDRQLGWETRLTIAGSITGDADLRRFQDHARITLRGTIADMTPLYDAHRVFVAPDPVALWNHVRAGAVERIRADCGREGFEQVVAGDLGVVASRYPFRMRHLPVWSSGSI